MISGAIVSAVILPEFKSTSAKIGRRPKSTALEAVAIKVRGVVIISSPGFNPRDKKAEDNANEPLANATENFEGKY